MEELFEEIQTFVNEDNKQSNEEQTYQDLLADFYHVPSYVERFKRGDTSC